MVRTHRYTGDKVKGGETTKSFVQLIKVTCCDTDSTDYYQYIYVNATSILP